jgi:hypothetical protein|tara:strand:+ start:3731 stop:4558 length:828 start_codon:yes stop_codon:yes gene_type:complete
MIYYTAITNAYFQLPPNKSGEHFICYHDGTVEEQEGWELREIKYSHDDPVRLSRHPKILCPIEGKSVYIDASKLHTVNDKFIEVSEEVLSNHDFFLMQHPHKYYYLEECAEHIHRGLVDSETIIDFTSKVSTSGYNFAKFFSPLGTVIWRNGPSSIDSLWWEWYMQGGRRDQLSLAVALQLADVPYGWSASREFINRWSDSNPIDGAWWKNKGGRYAGEKVDPTPYIDQLAKITGLSMQMRYRAAIMKETGDWLFGNRSGYWNRNDKNLVIVNGF